MTTALPTALLQAHPRSITSFCLYQDVVSPMHVTEALVLLFGQDFVKGIGSTLTVKLNGHGGGD